MKQGVGEVGLARPGHAMQQDGSTHPQAPEECVEAGAQADDLRGRAGGQQRAHQAEHGPRARIVACVVTRLWGAFTCAQTLSLSLYMFVMYVCVLVYVYVMYVYVYMCECVCECLRVFIYVCE